MCTLKQNEPRFTADNYTAIQPHHVFLKLFGGLQIFWPSQLTIEFWHQTSSREANFHFEVITKPTVSGGSRKILGRRVS